MLDLVIAAFSANVMRTLVYDREVIVSVLREDEPVELARFAISCIAALSGANAVVFCLLALGR